jgi:hypothetical protein
MLTALCMALGITPTESLVHHTQVRLVPRPQIKGAVPLMSSSTRILANHLPSARIRPTHAKTKLFSAIPNANTPSSESSRSQSGYAIGYLVFSAAYLLQILLAIRKTGFVTLAVANAVGGPLLASGLAFLLATAASHNRFSRDTCKRLNGLMVLYTSLGLLLVGLAPQFHTFFGWLWFGTSLSGLCLSVLGYLKGVHAQGKTFATETLRLTAEAQQTTLAMPQNFASLAYSCGLAVIASRKGLLCLEIFNLSLSSSSSYAIAARVSRFAKLTILGGTTVILKDAAHRGRLHAATFCFLNLLSSIVVGSTAGKFIKRDMTSFSSFYARMHHDDTNFRRRLTFCKLTTNSPRSL